jgi:3-phenylpropionate/trans-cinnamate dioxygenase ferredoxin reductase subunit
VTRTFAIVGAGTAGGSAAITLRAEGFDGRVVLIGDEAHAPYERPPLSKGFLQGDETLDELLLRPLAFYAEQDIDLRLDDPATALDPQARRLALASGEAVRYDALLLATGGRARRLRVPGGELPGVHTLRTARDAERLRLDLLGGGRAIVVGLGFIGCEAAASLRGAGLDVVAIEPLSLPLVGALGPEVGAIVAELHRANGVELVLGESVVEFRGAERVDSVLTSSGRVIPCDFAVVGVGMDPAVELAAAAGIALDGGIVVDEHCRTSADGVYAAGDVAARPDRETGRALRVEHWQNALREGAHAARSMLGATDPYDEVPWFWSDQYDRNIQYTGFHGPWDELVFRGDPGAERVSAFYLKDGTVRACLAINSPRDARRAARLIRDRVAVDAAALADERTDLRALGA